MRKRIRGAPPAAGGPAMPVERAAVAWRRPQRVDQGARLHGARVPDPVSSDAGPRVSRQGPALSGMARSAKGGALCTSQLEQPLRLRGTWRLVYEGRSDHRLDEPDRPRVRGGL